MRARAQHGLAGPGAMRGVAGMAGRGKAGRDDGALTGGRLSRRASDPAAEAERRAAQDKMFALDLDRVRNSARPAGFSGLGFGADIGRCASCAGDPRAQAERWRGAGLCIFPEQHAQLQRSAKCTSQGMYMRNRSGLSTVQCRG